MGVSYFQHLERGRQTAAALVVERHLQSMDDCQQGLEHPLPDGPVDILGNPKRNVARLTGIYDNKETKKKKRVRYE